MAAASPDVPKEGTQQGDATLAKEEPPSPKPSEAMLALPLPPGTPVPSEAPSSVVQDTDHEAAAEGQHCCSCRKPIDADNAIVVDLEKKYAEKPAQLASILQNANKYFDAVRQVWLYEDTKYTRTSKDEVEISLRQRPCAVPTSCWSPNVRCRGPWRSWLLSWAAMFLVLRRPERWSRRLAASSRVMWLPGRT